MTKEFEKNLQLIDWVSCDDALDAMTNDEKATEDATFFNMKFHQSAQRVQKHFERTMAEVRRGRLDRAREERTLQKVKEFENEKR